MAKYSELGNVKLTLKIVVPEWLRGSKALVKMIVVPEWLKGTRVALARMIVDQSGSGQNDCGTRVAPWLNLTFPNLF